MRNTSGERNILCGGVKPKRLSNKKAPICLDLWGRNNNISLRISDISQRMASNVPSIFFDLLEIATYVYCADQTITRGGNGTNNMGARWRRHLNFFIPVRKPDIWSHKDVMEALEDTLGFLSDDIYHFNFTKLSNPPSVESYLDFGIGPGSGFSFDEVSLFSGGLDSFAGAVHELCVQHKNVALVSHRSAPKIAPRQKELVQQLAKRCPKSVKLFHVPVWINKEKALSREFTQRTRSFLYASLAATVASMFKLFKIRFYENGIVSFNLPISAQVIGSRATRVTHPRVLKGFAEIFSHLTNKEFTVENPFLWKTKAETIRIVDEAGLADLIKHTVSCNHVYGSTKINTHCGVCSQCVDRRFGTLAAGQAGNDPEEMYKINVLTGELKPGPDRTLVESYVRTAQEINKMSDMDFFAHYGEITRALRYMTGSVDENAQRVLDLHRRHSNGVSNVMKTAFARNAVKIQNGTLPDSCLLILSLPEKYKTLYRLPGKEPVFRKEGQMWTICYDEKLINLEDTKGLHYIAYLLMHPNKDFDAADLQSFTIGEKLLILSDSAEDIVDKQAIQDYRSQLRDLEVELEEAETNNDLASKELITKEIEILKEQITGATGLGGKVRRTLDDHARARNTVGKAISRSMDNIKKHHFPLWQHLWNSLRSGIIFRYTPDRPISWQI